MIWFWFKIGLYTYVTLRGGHGCTIFLCYYLSSAELTFFKLTNNGNFCSDEAKKIHVLLQVCRNCGLLGYYNHKLKTSICSTCKTGENVSTMKLPYACKLLFQVFLINGLLTICALLLVCLHVYLHITFWLELGLLMCD